jgi:hypothetical protein
VLACALAVSRLLGAGRRDRAAYRFEWQSDGRWRVAGRECEFREADLAGASCTFGTWMLLRWSEAANRYWAVVHAGSVRPELFRTLQGRLRLAGPGGRRVADGNC